MGIKQALTKEEFLEILKQREDKLNAEVEENKRAELIETIWMLSPIINFLLLINIIWIMIIYII